MPTLEERIATLEGRMTPDLREEMQRGFGETRQEFTAVRNEMNRGFSEVRDEMALLRQDMMRGFERFDDRLQRMDDRMQRQFTWVVSIQLTTMVTVIGVLAAAFFRTLNP